MPLRRRYLSGDELVDMLVRRVPSSTDAAAIVAIAIYELAAVGVDVSGLVKAEVDEMDIVTYPESDHALARRRGAPRMTQSGGWWYREVTSDDAPAR